MPPPHGSRLRNSFENKNEKKVSVRIKDKDSVIARIEANLGPYFRIVVFDHNKKKVIQALGFSSKQKKHLPIFKNDIVFLDKLPNEGEVVEIDSRIGAAGEKQVKSLYDEGRIHSSVYSSSDGCSEGMTKALNDIFEDAVDIENI
jgi:hypothetical protein